MFGIVFVKGCSLTEVNPLSFYFDGNIPKTPKNALGGKFRRLYGVLQFMLNIKKY
tara:strand:+ start:6835 stop:6999 length:165 start_codon:yes stop_codon:yes gene_type:complete